MTSVLPPLPGSTSSPWRGPGVAVALGAALIFAGLGLPPLFEPDEGRYAAIAASFARTDDWVVPHIAGLPFHDKPPGVLWLVALAFEALGHTPFAARLVPALAGCLGLVVAAWLARRLAPQGSPGHMEAPLLAALALGTAPFWLGASRILVLDVPLATLVALGAGLALHGAGAFDGRWRWSARLAAGVVLGLALLAKGPVGPGLVGLGALAAALVERERRFALRLLEPTPWLVALAIAAPWTVAFGVRHPGGLWTFLVEENLQRFVSFHQHPRSAVIYAVTFAWGLGPALYLAAPRALARLRDAVSALRRDGRRCLRADALALEGRGVRALASFVVVGVAFFCASSAKLETYLLPFFPALAALLGVGLARALAEPAPARGLARAAGGVCALLLLVPLLLAGAGMALAGSAKDTLAAAAASAPLAAWMALPGAALAAWALAAVKRGDARAAVIRTLAAWLVASVAAVPLAVAFGEIRSAAPVVKALRERITPAHAVVSYGGFVRGLSFYLDEPVVIALDANEFPRSMFAGSPERFLEDSAAVTRFLAARRPALLVIPGDEDSWRRDALRDAAAACAPPVALVRHGRFGRFSLYEASPAGDDGRP